MTWLNVVIYFFLVGVSHNLDLYMYEIMSVDLISNEISFNYIVQLYTRIVIGTFRHDCILSLGVIAVQVYLQVPGSIEQEIAIITCDSVFA